MHTSNYESFSLSLEGVQKKAVVSEILRTNAKAEQFGMVLTQQDALALVETRNEALRDFGRVEFGGGILVKLIAAFYDSPYLWQQNYAETLHELLEIFYEFKNETLDTIGDDDLLALMRELFDGPCGGATELLRGRELDKLARSAKCLFDDVEDEDDEDDEDQEW